MFAFAPKKLLRPASQSSCRFQGRDDEKNLPDLEHLLSWAGFVLLKI